MSLSSSTHHGVITALSKPASHLVEINSNQHTRSHDVLEELAVHYRDVGLSDKISVAKIDVSSNDVPELITGYPTLKLYPASGHHPVTFQGNYREPIPLATLISFIHDHGRNQLEAGKVSLAGKSSNQARLSLQHEEL